MSRQVPSALILGFLALSGFGRGAEAGEFFHHHHREGTPPPGPPRVFAHTHERAGYPLCVSPHASPTHTPSFGGSFVGGGTACGGCARRVEDGTWGRDYEGIYLPRRVWLAWSHGARYQGGTGSYRTDGHPLPDVISLAATKLRTHGSAE